MNRTLADVSAFLHTGFDAWLITSEFIPPTSYRMQYAQSVRQLLDQIAQDKGKHPREVDTLHPTTELSAKATEMFLKLQELRCSIVKQCVRA